MIGGLPVLPQPGFNPAPPPRSIAQPMNAPAPGMASRPQTAPPSRQALPPPSAVRAQGADEPVPPPRPVLADNRPAPVTMPSPEELGITCARSASRSSADWSAEYRRLQELGAFCFQLEKLSQGGYQCTCLLPTQQPNRTRRIEAPAVTEADAVRLALDKAEQWSGQRK